MIDGNCKILSFMDAKLERSMKNEKLQVAKIFKIINETQKKLTPWNNNAIILACLSSLEETKKDVAKMLHRNQELLKGVIEKRKMENDEEIRN